MPRTKDRLYVQVLKDAPAHLHTRPFQAELKQSLKGMLGDSSAEHMADSELYAQVHYAVDTVLFDVLLRHFEGNQSKVADVLNISRGTLRTTMVKASFDISRYK